MKYVRNPYNCEIKNPRSKYFSKIYIKVNKLELYKSFRLYCRTQNKGNSDKKLFSNCSLRAGSQLTEFAVMENIKRLIKTIT